MSLKIPNIDNINNISKEISGIDENENGNIEEDEIKQVNNYNIINNLSSTINNQNKPNRAKGDTDDVEKVVFESTDKNNQLIEKYKNFGLNMNKENKNNNNNIEYNIENNYEEEKEEEDEDKNNNTNNISNSNKKDTQYYELNTNKLVEKIKNDYDDIYIKQNEDINKFVQNLAKENSLLKIEINKLKSELIKIKTEYDFYKKTFITFNNNKDIEKKDLNLNENKQVEINLEKYEKEKENIKEEYESILLNNTSSLIEKDIKSLYDKLIRCKDDLYNYQKLNILLQEENDKLKEENKNIKENILEERNKIIEKIIEIQIKTNSEIDLNKNLLLSNKELNNKTINNFFTSNNNTKINEKPDNYLFNSINLVSNNNTYLFYIEKIKSLTYEKNKLLSCNYDFFIKINDLSQSLEEKNNIINNQVQKINLLETQILNLEHEIKALNLKYNESLNIINDLQNKNSELIKIKIDSINLDQKLKDNKYNINKKQYENRITELNKSLINMNIKYEKLNKNYEELKEKYEIAKNTNQLFKLDKDKILNEKNNLIKDVNKLKTDLKLSEEKIVYNNRENETKIKLIYNKIDKEYMTNNKDNFNSLQIHTLINDIYNIIINKNKFFNNKLNGTGGNNSLNNNNVNISIFISNNLNDMAKLNEIKKQINELLNKHQIYSLINIENEKLKNHLKEIINLTLENTTSSFVQKYKENSINITIEHLILKIIDYIKVIKVCSLLQKIKTIINYSVKFLNWLNDKENNKNNNSYIQDIKNEIKEINNEFDNIKNIIKTNSLNIEKKFKNLLSKDEVKSELNNIQVKYEKIISGIFEYFLKFKSKNDKSKKSQEFLTLQIPIKSYNLMIENNMNNISSIGESIESWNLYINNDLDYNNDSIFQEIINLTNINNLVEFNNISDLVINNESTVNNNNINDSIPSSNNYEDNDNNTNSNKNQTQTSHHQENKSEYSFDNNN